MQAQPPALGLSHASQKKTTKKHQRAAQPTGTMPGKGAGCQQPRSPRCLPLLAGCQEAAGHRGGGRREHLRLPSRSIHHMQGCCWRWGLALRASLASAWHPASLCRAQALLRSPGHPLLLVGLGLQSHPGSPSVLGAMESGHSTVWEPQLEGWVQFWAPWHKK